MKKIILLILFTSSLSAQTIEFSGGYTNSSIDIQDVVHLSNGPRTFYILPENYSTYNYNVGIEYLNKNYFSLFSSAGFFRIGGKNQNNPYFSDGLKISNLTDTYLDLITVTTSGRLKSKNDYFTLYVESGLRLSYVYDTNESLKKNEESYYEKWHYFIDFGGGIYKDIKNFRLGVKYNYQYHLNSLYEKTGSLPESKMKASSMNLSIGYKL